MYSYLFIITFTYASWFFCSGEREYWLRVCVFANSNPWEDDTSPSLDFGVVDISVPLHDLASSKTDNHEGFFQPYRLNIMQICSLTLGDRCFTPFVVQILFVPHILSIFFAIENDQIGP